MILYKDSKSKRLNNYKKFIILYSDFFFLWILIRTILSLHRSSLSFSNWFWNGFGLVLDWFWEL